MEQAISTKYEHITGQASPMISISPVTLSSAHRPSPLQVRVSAPVSGTGLPVIIFSHGFGNSMDGYAPLVDFWASHGFVVIQATYLDSKRLGDFNELPYKEDIWRIRIDDVQHILDQLEDIENSFEAIRGRIAKDKIAAVGHSFGGHTTSMLLGSRIIKEDHNLEVDYSDERIKVGILLSAGGRGGDAMSDFAKEHLPYLNQDYRHMNTPTLVVAGDKDFSPLMTMGPEWFTDAYHLSPGANALVTIHDGEHMLGGISGYLVAETTDEDPRKVEAVQILTLAYLKSFFEADDQAWRSAYILFNTDYPNVSTVRIRS
jgi:pimeloyl-ACP methyl ester carboxylesterase